MYLSSHRRQHRRSNMSSTRVARSRRTPLCRCVRVATRWVRVGGWYTGSLSAFAVSDSTCWWQYCWPLVSRCGNDICMYWYVRVSRELLRQRYLYVSICSSFSWVAVARYMYVIISTNLSWVAAAMVFVRIYMFKFLVSRSSKIYVCIHIYKSLVSCCGKMVFWVWWNCFVMWDMGWLRWVGSWKW